MGLFITVLVFGGVLFCLLVYAGYQYITWDDYEKQEDRWVKAASKYLRKKTGLSKEWCDGYAEVLFVTMLQDLKYYDFEFCDPEAFVDSDMECWERG